MNMNTILITKYIFLTFIFFYSQTSFFVSTRRCMIKKPILKLFLSNFKVGKQTFNFTKWLFSQKLVDFSFFGNYILLSKISSYLETYLFNTLAADTRFEYRSIIIVKMSLWFRPPKMMTWFLINDTYWAFCPFHSTKKYWKIIPLHLIL